MGRYGERPLVWLHGEIKTPPMSSMPRVEAGYLLRRLQGGESLSLPESRPMPSIGRTCHELRIDDGGVSWWIFYRLDPDAVVLLEVLGKKTRKTPPATIANCKRRLIAYDRRRR